MSEQRDEDVGVTLDQLARETCESLIAAGMPVEIAKAFTCLRFHPHCAWGLGKIKLNDIETYAIVRPIDETYKNVECVFMVADKRFPLSDLTGLETIPEKSQLN